MPNPIPNMPWTDIFRGFYYGTTWSTRLWCNTCCVWQIHKTSPYYSNYEGDKFSRLGMPLSRSCMEITWITYMVISDCGPQFASGFMKELNKILGIDTNYLYSYCLSPTDRWTDREDESGVGAIFEDVRGLPPNELAGVAGNCRILI